MGLQGDLVVYVFALISCGVCVCREILWYMGLQGDLVVYGFAWDILWYMGLQGDLVVYVFAGRTKWPLQYYRGQNLATALCIPLGGIE